MVAFGADSSSSGPTLSTRKLQGKLDKLDPTKRLTILDWLVTFRAACGADFSEFFSEVQLEIPKTKEEFLSRFISDPKYIADDGTKLDALHDAELQAEFALYRKDLLARDSLVRDWLVTNVMWGHDAVELKRLVRGSAADHSDGWSVAADGGSRLYTWLLDRGGCGAPEVQKGLTADWAVLFAEAHNARIGRPRSVRLFTDLSSYDAVIAKMQCVLDNYEGVPALNAQAPQVFIDTMLQLLKDEVPQLTEWAAREQQALDLDEVVYATRSLWVETKVNKLLRASLPAANPVYQPADESRSGGALNAMGGGARRPGNKADLGRSCVMGVGMHHPLATAGHDRLTPTG